jgi:adenylate kinase family enzyme
VDGEPDRPCHGGRGAGEEQRPPRPETKIAPTSSGKPWASLSDMGGRFTIAGTSGSGKTTVGRTLATQLDLQFVELDALNHGPNWAEATDEEFRGRVEAAIDRAPGGWVIDGNYGRKLGDLVLRHADTLVWLDLPLYVCLRRLWRRTWGRILRREALWNGNRETLRAAFFMRDSLFHWTIKSHRRLQIELPERLARNPHLDVIRLHSQAEVERWLAAQGRRR